MKQELPAPAIYAIKVEQLQRLWLRAVAVFAGQWGSNEVGWRHSKGCLEVVDHVRLVYKAT